MVMDTTAAPPGARAGAVQRLTARERHVLAAMAQGLSNAEIGGRLALSAKTIECHVGSIFTKLDLYADGAKNRRVQAVLIWLWARGDLITT
jgi:DNA-binding NarL/FixJ family response regulator